MMSVEISVNRTMMLIYQINPVRVASSVTPIPLARMVDVFTQPNHCVLGTMLTPRMDEG